MSTIRSEKKYISNNSTSFLFTFVGFFVKKNAFFVFFPLFESWNSILWNKICKFSHAATAKFYYRIRFFGNFPETLGMSGSQYNNNCLQCFIKCWKSSTSSLTQTRWQCPNLWLNIKELHNYYIIIKSLYNHKIIK